MWLLPAFSLVASTSSRIFYRLAMHGPPIPSTGPVLIVANHPNSLFDPLFVAAAARRPVRFLAKAPLFADAKIGWLIKASGAIPVYRKIDDPTAMGANEDMFSAVFTALEQGAVVGIFPEGISHSEPSLAPLKTGAARIALGTKPSHETLLPIIPVGLTLRDRGRFRSEATVVLGDPIAWSDLAHGDAQDRATVQALTDRIEQGMRSVTVNVDRWADQPIVECAEAVWAAEIDEPGDERTRVERIRIVTEMLGEVVRSKDEALTQVTTELSFDLKRHDRVLRRLRLTPSSLNSDYKVVASARWALSRIYLLGVPAVLIAVISRILLIIPFKLTGVVAASTKPLADQISTHKFMYGLPIYLVWTLGLATAAALLFDPLLGVVTLFVVPVLGVLGLSIRERWRSAWRDSSRFFMMRRRKDRIGQLRASQRALAQRLHAYYEQHQTRRSP